MKTRTPRYLYGLLFGWIAITLTFQLVAAVSLVIGFFDLRHQVKEPFEMQWYQPVVTRTTPPAEKAGLRKGDFIESLDGVPFVGRVQMQSARWYAQVGDSLRLGIRREDGSKVLVAVPLSGYDTPPSVAESLFILNLEIAVPLACLLLGYWVAFARPSDLNAWLILVLLTYPQGFISVSAFNWWPEWLPLRLFWHLAITLMAPVALLWLGLLFPERSRLDAKLPWLKWLFLVIQITGVAVEFASDYIAWYDWRLFPHARAVDTFSTYTLQSVTLASVLIFAGTLIEKLITTRNPDARRRLRVLAIGSAAGLGTNLVIWTILPRFGYSPTQMQWLGYTSAVLMLLFPLTLAYVVVVQRALDVRLLLRMGTKYALARTTLLIVQLSVLAFVFFRLVLPVLQRHQDKALTFVLPVAFALLLLRFYFVKRSIWDRLREKIDRRFFREVYNTEVVLSELAESVRGIMEPEPLLNAVSGRICEVLHIPRLAVLLRNGDCFRIQSITGSHPEAALVLDAGSTPVRHLVATSVPAVLYRDRPEDWYVEAGEAERRALDQLHAEVLLPLAGRNKLMGMMVLGPKLSEEPYSQIDLRLLAAVGAQVGLGLEINDLAQSLAHEAARGERMAREVEIAREVQQRLFPQHLPDIPGLDLAGHCRPALAVGGDYYDIIELEDGRLALAIGDVSGKGIGASLLMASLRASLRGMTDSASRDLARMIRKLNRLVYESSTSNRYATFFFAIYDPVSRELHYVNGGHNAPAVIRAGEVIRLEATGPVVGLLPDVEFEEQSITLHPGDLFIGYTDGISEAMTVDDEEWGDERMIEAAQGVRSSSSRNILEILFKGADDFAAGAPQYDDMTLLIVKVA